MNLFHNALLLILRRGAKARFCPGSAIFRSLFKQDFRRLGMRVTPLNDLYYRETKQKIWKTSFILPTRHEPVLSAVRGLHDFMIRIKYSYICPA